MADWTTANTSTEQHLYKHDLSGNKYSDIRSSKVITLIKKLLLSQKNIYLHESFDAHRNFPTVFSQKPSVYVYISKKIVPSFWRISKKIKNRDKYIHSL